MRLAYLGLKSKSVVWSNQVNSLQTYPADSLVDLQDLLRILQFNSVAVDIPALDGALDQMLFEGLAKQAIFLPRKQEGKNCQENRGLYP
jgi:hypothetical protein